MKTPEAYIQGLQAMWGDDTRVAAFLELSLQMYGLYASEETKREADSLHTVEVYQAFVATERHSSHKEKKGGS
jgi:hypothetical protein